MGDTSIFTLGVIVLCFVAVFGLFFAIPYLIEKNVKGDSESNSPDPNLQYYLLAGRTSHYEKFNEKNYNSALSENKTILLVSYSDSCSACATEQINVFDVFNQLSQPKLIGFRLDYNDVNSDDSEKAIIEKYGISSLNEKLILRNGEKLLNSKDAWSKERYLAEIDNYF